MKATLRHIHFCRTANMSWRTCIVVKQIQFNNQIRTPYLLFKIREVPWNGIDYARIRQKTLYILLYAPFFINNIRGSFYTQFRSIRDPKSHHQGNQLIESQKDLSFHNHLCFVLSAGYNVYSYELLVTDAHSIVVKLLCHIYVCLGYDQSEMIKNRVPWKLIRYLSLGIH